jgi:hypothetical protein
MDYNLKVVKKSVGVPGKNNSQLFSAAFSSVPPCIIIIPLFPKIYDRILLVVRGRVVL